MKILTITLHAIDNCGSCLQAYALQQYLISKGFQNEIIDYRPRYARNNGAPMKDFIKKLLFGKAMKARWKLFDDFVKQYLILTREKFFSYKALQAANFEAHCYIVGSDQVWNSFFSCGRDPAYYLQFTQGKKISYAASIGKTPIPEKDLELIADRIKDFQAVSVRELCSVAELRRKNIDAVGVCDPTLLQNREFYEKIAITKESGKYILVYLTEKRKLLNAIIKKYKETYGYKVVYVGSFLNRCECDVNYTDVGPREFLGLIRDAAFIVAGSYHALLFSCIFQKEFVILPYKNNARMEQFMWQFGLEQRYVSDIKDVENLPVISWEHIQTDLSNFVQESKKWLTQNLEGMIC